MRMTILLSLSLSLSLFNRCRLPSGYITDDENGSTAALCLDLKAPLLLRVTADDNESLIGLIHRRSLALGNEWEREGQKWSARQGA